MPDADRDRVEDGLRMIGSVPSAYRWTLDRMEEIATRRRLLDGSMTLASEEDVAAL